MRVDYSCNSLRRKSMIIKPQIFRVHKTIKSATIIFYNIYNSVFRIKFKTRSKWMIYILTPLHDIGDTCNINIPFCRLPFLKIGRKRKNVPVFAIPLWVFMLFVFRIWISPLQKPFVFLSKLLILSDWGFTIWRKSV